MATVRGETTKRINRNKLMKFYAYVILAGLVVIGFIFGFITGRCTAPEKVKTVTVTETVEVPTVTSRLPETADIDYYDIPLSHSLQEYIMEICADEEVPPTMVLAIIEHESRFNPEAVSTTEDYGLMQVNKINHPRLEEKYRTADMLNPYQNVYCGVKILSSYLNKYEGDYVKALMAYNMGDYGAQKAWADGTTSTNYTTSILGLMEEYEEVRGNAENADNE